MTDEPRCALQNTRWWSGWPGAYCSICGRSDPWEEAVGDGNYDPLTKSWKPGTLRMHDFSCPAGGIVVKENCVIFDLDGTLANIDHRLHFVKGKPQSWPAFYAAMEQDKVNEDVAVLCRVLAQHYPIVICTGRPENYTDVTFCWLTNHMLPQDHIYFRGEKDYRPDTIVKAEMLEKIQQDYNVMLVVDDRQSVVEMWRSKGLRCLQVASWKEE